MGSNLLSSLMMKRRESEGKFIASIYSKPEVAAAEFGYISPDYFLTLFYKEFWKSIQEHGDSLKAAMEAGCMDEILRSMTTAEALHRPDIYLDQLKRYDQEIELLEASTRIVQLIAKDELESAVKLMDNLANNREKYAPIENTAVQAADVGLAFIDFINEGKRRTISTRIPQLDKAFGGFLINHVTVLASRTNVGKTALAWQIARNIAEAGKHVLYISTEATTNDMWVRAACGACRIDNRRVMSNEIDADDIDNLTVQTMMLIEKYGGTLYIDDKSTTLEQIHRVVSMNKPEFLVIDHLEELYVPKEENRVVYYGVVMDYLKHLAKLYDMAVLLIHQLRREEEKRLTRRPVLSDLKWSGSVEQKATAVLMIHREDISDEENKVKLDEVVAEVWIRKNKFGPRDVLVNLLYDLIEQWFYDNRRT